MQPDIKSARLFLWNGRALFCGPAGEAASHRHQALQLVVSLGDGLRLNHDGSWHEHRAALIRPDAPHRLHPGDAAHGLLLLDPQASQALALAALLPPGQQAMGLAPPRLLEIVEGFTALGHNANPCPAAHCLTEKLISALTGEKHPSGNLDPRVGSALKVMAELPPGKIKLAEVAKRVALSESRLSALFRQQIGLPMQRYFLWQRLMRSAALAAAGEDLTLCAHEAGFADSAHLSRTFRDMFGLSPSLVFKKSGFVQVFSCVAA